MKSNNLIALQSQGIKKTILFSWENVQRIYNIIPLGITKCQSIYDAKMYSCVLMAILTVVFIPLIIPLICLYCSIKNENKEEA